MIAMPTGFERMPSSFGYAALGDDAIAIIDPGMDSPHGRATWQAFLSERGRDISEVDTVVATHGHIDHLGAAAWFREESGARIVLSGVEQIVLDDPAQSTGRRDFIADNLETWGVPLANRPELIERAGPPDFAPPVRADAHVRGGEELELGGHVVEVLATPGHSGGHLGFVAHELGRVFTGDTVLPTLNPGVGIGAAPESEPLSEYLATLRRLGAYDEFEALPGHEFRFRGLAARCESLVAHHLRRAREIEATRAARPDASIWEVATGGGWSHSWQRLSPRHQYAALRQTALHIHAHEADSLAEYLEEAV